MRNVSTKAATVFHQYIGGTLRGAVKVPPHSCYFNAYSVCPNTKVLIPSEAGVPTYLELHGNLIARRDWHGKVEINLAGYPTPTTSDRLRAVVRKFGLTISKMIIQQLGGTISASSKFGEGSKFSFKFPIPGHEREEYILLLQPI